MITTITGRLKELYRFFNISETKFANSIDVNPATLNTYTTGKRQLGSDVIVKVLTHYPQISAEWFMRGVGNMLNDCCGDDNGVYTHASAGASVINNGGDNNGTQQISNGDSAKDVEIRLLREQIANLNQMLQQNNQLIQMLLNQQTTNK